ncbi:MAG: hypothetical protein JGK17_04350 [Microcoleus sp. PH2017_10_PVI_O_A]|uniref:hypothetical protein n=1 Tax=unclassified Microcoleus TaxID=2642155 RepID=UPI001DD68E24|nr:MULTISPECIES: hypothetical protein [unclassified Microcoleus]TAE85041.1 MAG: hypothetical protein EAZ83_03845 [Oscillatoriales cyanobacterium]MCC3404818.1 hypothetical protein [Microcoleus sp. PH2017_10_PVI_O_A]MCC3458924.1 hypothetical protein [Microcoleus sp. PH2017_11_PCY_U_A]MCC3477125.1 hypothetical protein [Microcoleus sp. PH2017_12_PCY_D_A]MCC3558320.1 hypothetical protein [Microcoleus sp. PH2017_27_LUM_O_A]
MSATPQPTPESNILGNFASVVGLLGAALFFTGWIYRWSYFYFFQIQVTTLDLPVESFFMVPLQVFLADGPTIFRSAIAILLTAFAIYQSLWLVNSINHKFATTINRRTRRWRFYARTRRLWLLLRFLKSWQRFNINKYNSIKLLRSLVDELIIVSWVLLVLFSSASHQGIADARRDAGENSTLPAVALIAKQDNIALGRKPDDETLRSVGKGFKAIGDIGLFADLSQQDFNHINNSKEPIVWRLLLDRGNWIYLFPALTKAQQKDPNARPLVVAVQQSQSGDQLLIVSPAPSKLSK